MKPLKRTLMPAHNILHQQENPLDVFFKPTNVAVIGATESAGSVGRTTLWNLISSPFGGTVFPVNPKRASILGIKAYPNVREVPADVDLAVIITPAPSVPGVIRECAEAGARGAIVISAGFQELGPEGEKLQQQVKEEAIQGGMRIIGPNCLGLMCPVTGLNASFAATMARPGTVGFISQSGALCTGVLDWSMEAMVGFSAFISVGAMVDVGWGDLIDYLGNDPRTRSILIYMESVGNARAFLSAAREVALTKPIIVIKAGRTAAGGRVAASHTGAMTGSDDVLDAAFRRIGVLRVTNISELFYMADVLAKQPRPRGPRLTILTNAGGPAVLATDALISNGGELAELAPETVHELNRILPPHWSHNNPIDILGDAGPERYAKALEIAFKDPNSDGLLVVLTPQAMTDATRTAELLKPYANFRDKPVLASWMGGNEVVAGETLLNRADIPTFAYPDTAAKVFTSMFQYSENLRALYETPEPSANPSDMASGRAQAEALIARVKQSGRTILTEAESKELLSSYAIPTVVTKIAATEDEAARIASEIGYPSVLKLYSETITHKTDVGGVQLNLADEAAVRKAFADIKAAVTEKKGAEHFQGVTVQKMINLKDGYEVILGSSVDPQFGPVLLFGLGGQLVEVFKDKALGLPPLTTTLARRMMEQTKIYTALKGVRGRKPVKLAALQRLLVGFSQLVAEQPWIKEIDINPLFASSDELVALDARVILHEPSLSEDQLPKLAIRPYPSQYMGAWKMKDGTSTVIRPIRPEDEPLLVKFHEGLSERSVYLRYFSPLNLSQRIAHDRLVRICHNDYDHEIALVADYRNAETGQNEILAVARMSKMRGMVKAEFAVVVTDHWQKKGLGLELTQRLIQVARDEKLTGLVAYTLRENQDMQAMCKKLGFQVRDLPGDTECVIEMNL